MADQASEWTPFLSQLADREERRKGALESRATGMATIGAAVIAILTAATALGTRTHIAVPRSATVAVVVALLLFLLSLVSAMIANLPYRLRQADPAGLMAELRGSERVGTSAWKRIAATYVADYASLNSANNFKAAVLWFGLSCQAIGCSALTIFILQTL